MKVNHMAPDDSATDGEGLVALGRAIDARRRASRTEVDDGPPSFASWYLSGDYEPGWAPHFDHRNVQGPPI